MARKVQTASGKEPPRSAGEFTLTQLLTLLEEEQQHRTDEIYAALENGHYIQAQIALGEHKSCKRMAKRLKELAARDERIAAELHERKHSRRKQRVHKPAIPRLIPQRDCQAQVISSEREGSLYRDCTKPAAVEVAGRFYCSQHARRYSEEEIQLQPEPARPDSAYLDTVAFNRFRRARSA